MQIDQRQNSVKSLLFTFLNVQAPLIVNTWQESMGQKVKFNSKLSVILKLAMGALYKKYVCKVFRDNE